MEGLFLENLSSGYTKDIPIVKNCSLSVHAKETLVLMGPSGSGKSTLLLTILGILPPLQGKIFLNEKEISCLPIEERNIGYLPQDYGLFPHLNVLENVAFGLKVRGVPKNERKEKAFDRLHLVNLEKFAKNKVQELSGGQKQRVGLARALCVNPSLLLLDEPLSNIDLVTKQEVAFQLKALFEKLNIPIILVTHNREDALFLAQTLAIMVDGSIEQIGPLQEVKNHPKTEFIKRLLSPFERDDSFTARQKEKIP